MRVSDADRERVAARLRDHFAEGRLTQDELDERISAALHAKTAGDLRPLTSDLPEPAPVSRGRGYGGSWRGRRSGPRALPLFLLALAAALLIPSASWLAFTFVKAFALFWLLACVAGFFIARTRWRMYHHHQWHHDDSDQDQGYGRWRGH
ncbi:MAG TPA: DUF1707 domain-containing protein [Streptosporangiaceae bacterium]